MWGSIVSFQVYVPACARRNAVLLPEWRLIMDDHRLVARGPLGDLTDLPRLPEQRLCPVFPRKPLGPITLDLDHGYGNPGGINTPQPSETVPQSNRRGDRSMTVSPQMPAADILADQTMFEGARDCLPRYRIWNSVSRIWSGWRCLDVPPYVEICTG
jgi:hypothetical protein